MGVKISELPQASAANSAMEFEVNDSGVSRKVLLSQMALTGGQGPQGPQGQPGPPGTFPNPYPGSITVDGDITATGTISGVSDERLKKDWQELPEDFIERLAGVKSGTFTRIDGGERQVGVGAQSLQKILPEAVLQNGEYLTVAYGNAALAACVALARRVAELEAKLEGR